MSEGHPVRPVPQFLMFLAAFPHPATVPRALTLGPLSNFNAQGSFFAFPHHGDHLRTLGGYGFTDDEMNRYSLVPLSISSPLTDVYKSSEMLILSFEELWDRYEVVRMDRELWEGMAERFSGGDVVHVPIIAQGTTMGVLGFYTKERHRWDSREIAYVESLGALIGIWATHPLSGVKTPEIWRPVSDAVISLSERQQVILRLIESGKSNASIAMALGYSPSTVKAEIQKSLRALRVNDRVAAAARARELGILEDEKAT